MKILYILNQRMPTDKAYGIQVISMCSAFVSAGAEVTLAYPTRQQNDIKVDLFEYYGTERNFASLVIESPDQHYFPDAYVFRNKLGFYRKHLRSGWRIFRKLRPADYDIVYTREMWPLLLLLLTNPFVKKVYEMHKYSDSLFKKFSYTLLRLCGVRFVTISRGLEKKIKNIGFKDGGVLVAPDGVDMSKFDIEISQEDARRQLDLPQDKKIALYAGHLFSWKGFAALALAAQDENLKDALVVFVGGTHSEIDKFQNDHVIGENVKLIGHVSYGRVPLYLQAADVLVLPNKNDGGISALYTSPLKMFEYMASGRPIVASDLPSIREVLNESNAVLVKPDKVEALAQGIRQLLDNPDIADRLAKKAFEDVQQYTWQKRAKKILDFLS